MIVSDRVSLCKKKIKGAQMGRMRHNSRKEILWILRRIAQLLCFIVTKVAEVMGEYGSTCESVC